MRLAYPVLWSRPNRQACQEQTVNTAAALARQGVTVTLIVPRGPGDPALCAEEMRGWCDVRGDFRLVQRPSRWSGERLVPSLAWLRQAFRDPEVQRADCLYSRAPAMLAAGGFSPRPFATDLYRAWPDELPMLRPLFRRTATRRHCLGLILHSEYAARSYLAAGVPADRLLVAHNGADMDRMLPRIGKAEARRRLGLASDRPIAVYAGRINARKGLDQLFALADLRPGVRFLLVGAEGDGPIEAEAARRANIALAPWQAPADLPAYLEAADLLLIPASTAPLERFGTSVLPIKTLAYLAAGRPILAPQSPDTAGLLVDGVNALLVEPDRPEKAAEALDRILSEPGLASALGEGAAQSAIGRSWDARAASIARFLEARLGAAHASV
jgi:glycosyltransferase involved in cell wall biosynthesis